MNKHYFYLDESGSLDFKSKPGETYFGVGTAYISGQHANENWIGHELKVELEKIGMQVPKGVHAHSDSHETRGFTYQIISSQPWRFDSTFLRKDAAFESVRAGGKPRLYKMALWLHLKYVIQELTNPGDEIVLIVGDIKISEHRSAIRHAVEDICNQLKFDRPITLCIWEASAAWGVQVADYALWRIQREIEGRKLPSYALAINHQIAPTYFPWGE